MTKNMKRYQIGIIGATMNGDYGLTASYLGMYEFLSNNMKYNTTIIPPGKNKKWQDSTVSFFNDNCNCLKKTAIVNYYKYQDIIEIFLLGPGGLWDYSKFHGNDADYMSYLNFLNDDTKRMSYSTSFITDYPTVLKGHPEKLPEYTELLKRFNGLGIACETDKECLHEFHGIDKSICVIDPIFLPKRQYWINMVKNKNYNKDNNIVLYPINKISRKETCDNVSIAMGVKNTKIATGLVFDCQEMVDKTILLDNTEYINPPKSPLKFETWLEKIFNCKYLMCADYYSLCFALIFNKNFIIFENTEDNRIGFLIKKLGLQDRVVQNNDEMKIVDLFKCDIDYIGIYTKIYQYRKESIMWLYNKIKKLLE